jgi:membrane protease YdiL (CAAX protease family)
MDLFWGEDGRLRSGWRFGLSVFFFLVVNSFAVDIANAWAGPSDRKFELLYRPLLMVFLVAAFSVLLKTLDRVDGNPLPAMGLVPRYFLPDMLVGFIGGAVMVSLAVLPIAIGYHLGFHVVFSRHSLKLACAVLFILATGAMAEEVAFRGYPFQRLVDAAGGTAAIVFSSALFGVVHLRNPHASVFSLINTIVFGVLLAIAYLRTQALWLPWGLHFGWNLTLGFVFGLPVSGIPQFAVVVRGTADGPGWLTGGAYGIEGGAAGTLGVVAGLCLLVIGLKSRPKLVAQGLEKEKTLTDSDSQGIQLSQGSSTPGAS